MNNTSYMPKLLQLYRMCMEYKTEEIAESLQMLFQKELTFWELCMSLFVAGEYIRTQNDRPFWEHNKDWLLDSQQRIVASVEKPTANLQGEENAYYTSNLGMAFGALYNSNLFLKNETTAYYISKMKNEAYSSYTKEKKLVSRKNGNDVEADLLWACIPFGLFSPEDLVLVEAVKEMQAAGSLDKAMLAWYYAEKADYRKAKGCLGTITTKEPLVEEIIQIVKVLLIQAKALGEDPIQHMPLGNFNRYQAQNFERTPWFPKEGEAVTIYCTTWPLPYEKEIVLLYETEQFETHKVKGIYQEKEENYRFEMGHFRGGSQIRYVIQAGEYQSESFCFTVLKKEKVQEVKLLRREQQEIILELKMESGEYCHLPIQDNGRLHVEKAESFLFVLLGDQVCIKVEELYFWKENEKIVSTGMKVYSPKEEHFYGFGERYNHINQRENLVDVYVYNQYKDQGIKTYVPMPYFISSQGYGIHVPTDTYTVFDMCHTSGNTWMLETEMEKFSFTCFIGTPKEMISQFVGNNGGCSMLPDWAFGPWMSSNNWDSEQEVRYQVEKTKELDIPATVLVIEAWADEATYYIFNDALYTENDGEESLCYEDFTFPKEGRWPNPKAMVEYLHENNLKCILWQIPIIKYINSLHHLQNDRDEAYALKHHFCVTKEDGTPYRMPEGWFTGSLLFDYTNPKACKWWFDKRDYLLKEVGVDGFKTDGGEFVFGDNLNFADGRTGKEMRNEYPNLYAKSYYDFVTKEKEGMVFSRAGFTGAGQMPAHWAGDERSTFAAFKRNLCAGLNAGVSGIPFWGWDLGGFSGEIPTAELYMRSVSMAAFCPIMQYHAESKAEFNQDRTPWNIAERRNAPWIIDNYRFYAKLRMAMLPYILEQAAYSAKTGIPLMRAMFVEFPKEDGIADIYDQYMFGEEFLVAPIIEEGATERTVYIPKGTWRHVFTGTCFEGGVYVKLTAEVDEIIVLQRDKSPWKICAKSGEYSIRKEV